MKKRALIITKLIGSLIIPLGTLAPYVGNVFFYERKELATITSPFSYQSQAQKETGFNHVKFKQFEIYNPRTKKYEYYLDDYGKEYLIRRFLATTIIGPEISSLKAIVIGDERVVGTNLGVYYPIAAMIFINPFPFLNNTQNLWASENPKELSEKRAEAILPTLVHEYGHHFFNSYASSPIGYSPISDRLLNFQRTQHKEAPNETWNKFFYDKFKILFFENGIVFPSAFDNSDQWLYKAYNNVESLTKKSIAKSFLPDGIETNNLQIYEYKNTPKLYKQFPNVGRVFKFANEGLEPEIEFGKQTLLVGSRFGATRSGTQWQTHIPIIKKIEFDKIYYHYAIGEQVVRKLLLATFKPSGKFKDIDAEAQDDNFFSNDYISSYYIKDKLKASNWYRFYSDNVYPAANVDLKPDRSYNTLFELPREEVEEVNKNRSKALVEGIIDELMGHKNHAQLSFITTKNSWWVATKGKAYSANVNNRYGDFDKLKIGGFVDSDQYNYIGYKGDSETTFQKTPIKVNKFKIWYKNNLESKDGQKLKSDRGENREYYWYTNGFVDKARIMGKKLYFLTVNKKGVVTNQKKLTSVRQNNYGIANNFNLWKVHDKTYIKKRIQGLYTGPKWLIVGKVGDGVKLGYYENQDRVEQIWSNKWL